MTDNSTRIIDALRRSSVPLDDDQLAQAAGVEPRQQVNQICHRLRARGVLRRYPGDHGKIVNALTTSADATAPPAITVSTTEPRRPHAQPDGDSSEQRQAERAMLDVLGTRLNVTLEPARITIDAGRRLEIDGIDETGSVLVECWAHQGPAKSAQRHKVLADASNWRGSAVHARMLVASCASAITKPRRCSCRPLEPGPHTRSPSSVSRLSS